MENAFIILALLSILVPLNIAYYIPVVKSVIVVADKELCDIDNVPVILLLIAPLVIQNASIILYKPSPSSPPANTAYYIPVLASVIVVAATLYRAFDSLSVILLLIAPLVIQNASITSVGPVPPPNTAYYLPVAESITVVAAKSYLPSDSLPVIGALIAPLVIQTASIISDEPSPPANTAYYILLSAVSVIVVAVNCYLPRDNLPVIGALIAPLVIQTASITLSYKPVPPPNTAYYMLLSLVSVIVVAATQLLAFDSVPVILLLITPLTI